MSSNLFNHMHLNQGGHSRQSPADPLRLAEELEFVAAHMRSVADQAMLHVHSVRQRRHFQSSSSSSSPPGSRGSFDHRSESSSHKHSRSSAGGESTVNQQHAFRVKGTVSPDGKFAYSAEIGSASSTAKFTRQQAMGVDSHEQQSAPMDSSWSIPVSEIMYPDDLAKQAKTPAEAGTGPIFDKQGQQASEPIIHFPKPQDAPINPTPPSSDTASTGGPKPLSITETRELSSWPATWTWLQANKFAVPLMITLLFSTFLARWLAMRRALAGRRGHREKRRVHSHQQQQQVVEIEQVVEQVVMDESGKVIGGEETVSVEKRVLPPVYVDSATQAPLHRGLEEQFDRKQRDWKLELVRIPFWYILSSLAALAACLVLDSLVLRPFTLPIAPPAATAVNHPLVDLGLAMLHMGVVGVTMAALARTVGFVRKEWDQYRKGE